MGVIMHRGTTEPVATIGFDKWMDLKHFLEMYADGTTGEGRPYKGFRPDHVFFNPTRPREDGRSFCFCYKLFFWLNDVE